MMSETTYIGDTKWMQVPEPLSDEQIEVAREGNTITVHAFARAIEKAHGIGGE